MVFGAGARRRALSTACAILWIVAVPAIALAQHGPPKGTLVVAGGAETSTEIYERFIELAGGPDVPILVVPTSGTADEFDETCDCLAWLRRAGARNLALLHTRDRAVANSDSFVRPLKSARGVWFAEGNSWRHADAYLDTKVHRELLALLDRGGVVGGGSAGARIQGDFIPLRSPEPRERAIPEKDWRRGFQLLRGVIIDPHVLARNRQFDLISIVNAHPDMLGLGIDENTAIVVRGDEFEVIGSSYVLIYDNRRQLVADTKEGAERSGHFYMLRRGDTYDLAKRAAFRGTSPKRPIERVVERPWARSAAHVDRAKHGTGMRLTPFPVAGSVRQHSSRDRMNSRDALTADLQTPERILATAEMMFADQGYRGVSLRSITRESGTNIAAIHYHFGSKATLLEQIFERRCGPMNRERLRLLSLCREAAGAPPILEQILEAYLRPSLIWPNDPDGARRFLRLRAVLSHENESLAADLISKHFNDVSRTFASALHGVLPHLTLEQIYWRFQFLLSAQYYTLSNPGRVAILSEGICDPSDAEAALRYMVPFCAAVFRAPEPPPDGLMFAQSKQVALAESL